MLNLSPRLLNESLSVWCFLMNWWLGWEWGGAPEAPRTTIQTLAIPLVLLPRNGWRCHTSWMQDTAKDENWAKSFLPSGPISQCQEEQYRLRGYSQVSMVSVAENLTTTISTCQRRGAHSCSSGMAARGQMTVYHWFWGSLHKNYPMPGTTNPRKSSWLRTS